MSLLSVRLALSHLSNAHALQENVNMNYVSQCLCIKRFLKMLKSRAMYTIKLHNTIHQTKLYIIPQWLLMLYSSSKIVEVHTAHL